MKRGAYGAVLAAALASVVFAASAAAGNPHAGAPGQQVQAGASVASHGQGQAHANTSSGGGASVGGQVNAGVKAHGKAHANAVAGTHANGQAKGTVGSQAKTTVHTNGHVNAGSQTKTTVHTNGHVNVGSQTKTTVHTNGHVNAGLHAGAATRLHTNAHLQTKTSVGAVVQVGLKPSARAGFNVLVPASSSQTKLYGNGMTAGQIALQGGTFSSTLFGPFGAMLFGPGRSQAHLIVCRGPMFDVHALKAHVGACGSTAGVKSKVQLGAHANLGVVASSGTQTSLSAGLRQGLKPSATAGFNVVAPASSTQTKLYGNGMTAGQIALQAGLAGGQIALQSGTAGPMLFGPGRSQAHKVLCGSQMVDVHALKTHLAACTTGTTLAPTATGVSPAASTSASTGASLNGSATVQSSTQSSAVLGANTAVAGKANIAAAGKAKGRASGGVLGATANQAKTSNATGAVLGATARRGTLPFTGLALGLPLGLALMLLVSGLGIRRAARQQ